MTKGFNAIVFAVIGRATNDSDAKSGHVGESGAADPALHY